MYCVPTCSTVILIIGAVLLGGEGILLTYIYDTNVSAVTITPDLTLVPMPPFYLSWLIFPYTAVMPTYSLYTQGCSPQRSPSPNCEPDWPGGDPGSGLLQESLTTPGNAS